MTLEERIKILRRCYSLYLWAYTVAVGNAGVVNFDLEDDVMDSLGVDVTLAYQRAVAMGARHGHIYHGHAPMEPTPYPDFLDVFKIEDSKAAEENLRDES